MPGRVADVLFGIFLFPIHDRTTGASGLLGWALRPGPLHLPD